MHPLLTHVATELCDDPDCEVHHIEVGLEEGTIDDVNLAFFLAGVLSMWTDTRSNFEAFQTHLLDLRP